jgi:surface protein
MRQMFEYATAFNQDLNSWSVDNVTDCANFNYYAPQWTLPKPNLDPSCLE